MDKRLEEVEAAITEAQKELEAAETRHKELVFQAEKKYNVAKDKHEQDLRAAHDKVVQIQNELSGPVSLVEQVGLYHDRLELGVKSFPLTSDLQVFVIATGEEHKGPYKEPIRLGSDKRSLSFRAKNETCDFTIALNPDHIKQIKNLAVAVKAEIAGYEKRQALYQPKLKEAQRRRDLVETDKYDVSVALAELKAARDDNHEVRRALSNLESAMRKKIFLQFRLSLKGRLSPHEKKED